jgi:cytoskeletal protein CcmA (bactofilin family)
MSSRRLWVLIAGLAFVLVLGVGVVAAGGGPNDKVLTGDRVTIEAGETVSHDLYVFGGNLIVDGTVEGDLVAGAGTVTINGSVDGDLVVGSGRVLLNGEVTGDVRAGAGEITVDGTVGEDLLAGTGVLRINAAGEVGEDLIFGAGQVVVDGTVDGNVLGHASAYTRTGTVGGTEDVTIETGGGEPGQPPEPEPSEPVRVVRDGLIHFVTVLLLGALALLLVPGAVRASEGALRRRPLASAGIGVGVIVGYLIQFIAVILLMILVAIAFSAAALDALSGIAVWLGIIDLLVSTFAFVVACAFIVDFVVGLALARLVTRDWAQNRWQELGLLAGGAFVVVLVTSLPEIGGIAKLVVIVLGLGAMGLAFAEWWQQRNPPVAPPFTPAAAGLAPAPVTPAVTAPEAPAPPAAQAPPEPAAQAPEAPAAPAEKPKRTRRTTAKPPTEPPPDSSAI